MHAARADRATDDPVGDLETARLASSDLDRRLLAALGALPAIVWNARQGWGSLAWPIEDTTTYQHRLRIFASPLELMVLEPPERQRAALVRQVRSVPARVPSRS